MFNNITNSYRQFRNNIRKQECNLRVCVCGRPNTISSVLKVQCAFTVVQIVAIDIFSADLFLSA